MQYLKNISIFFYGTVLGISVSFICLLFSLWLDFKIVLCFSIVLEIVMIVFASRKSRIFALGILTSIILLASFTIYVIRKATYENQMWIMVRDVDQYPGRVLVTSIPPGAKYLHIDSGLELVRVSGAPENIYYSKTGTIIATLPKFPNVKLQAVIKPDIKIVHFNFYLRTVNIKP